MSFTSRLSLVLIALPLAIATAAAQRPDSIAHLPEIGTTVVRSPLQPLSLGLSLTAMAADSARRGRPSPTLAELLAFVPGLMAHDRPDRSLDTRITIRGAGARANFGVRGIRVLIDGVPATLPDGQTPLTNLDLELVDRIEVARGPLASLHGTGSLGVVALHSPARFPSGIHGQGAISVGTSSPSPWQGHAAVGGGNRIIGGLAALSLSDDPGSRAHSAARQLRARGSLQWTPSSATTLTLRGNWASDPELQAPGALTLQEFEIDPRAASPNSLLRNAGKTLSQRQVSVALRQRAGAVTVATTAWLLARQLDNPLAAPAPAPALPSEGVFVDLDRQVAGIRAEVHAPPLLGTTISAGVDVQSMRDQRINHRHDAGVPFGDLYLDQLERITELGAFVHMVRSPGNGWLTRVGLRRDRIAYAVEDHLDPAASGERIMSAWSASGSLAWSGPATSAWIGIGTAFETPTSTELGNTPDGSTGLNRDLQPSRSLSAEAGIRHGMGTITAEAVAFVTRSRNAITPVAELGGRSYFDNVGSTLSRGMGATVAWRPVHGAVLRGTLTALRASFGDDAVAAQGLLVGGNRLPGVVPVSARVGGTFDWGHAVLDIDHGWSSATWADDANTSQVPGWGAGVTNALLRLRPASWPVEASVAVRNLTNRAHAIGVVVNGGFGRVVEPGGRRQLLVGLVWPPS